ncbi:MAG: hypothetical protein ABI627_33220 [Polyangiaceae bacterium]
MLLFNVGGYTDRQGNVSLGGTRLKLLGILYAGPQHVADGAIIVVPVPTAAMPVAQTRIPLNLGFIIKAKALDAFEKIFRAAMPPAATA